MTLAILRTLLISLLLYFLVKILFRTDSQKKQSDKSSIKGLSIKDAKFEEVIDQKEQI